MRISDWSTGVCSSDLAEPDGEDSNGAEPSGACRPEAEAVYASLGRAQVHRPNDAQIIVQRDYSVGDGEDGQPGVVALDGSAEQRQLADEAGERRYTDQRAEGDGQRQSRSEEHTSELTSLMTTTYAVFCVKK